jgi:hypothetical protein
MLNKEYDRLALDTSNMMMHHDGSRVRGVSSLEYMNMAGYGRLLMANMAEHAGRYDVAIGDSMSAYECFKLAENWDRFKAAYLTIVALVGAYRIPEERGDLKRRFDEIMAEYPAIIGKIEESKNAG